MAGDICDLGKQKQKDQELRASVWMYSQLTETAVKVGAEKTVDVNKNSHLQRKELF